MANDRILFTLLHISDLHFGDTLGGYGIDELSSKLPALIRVPFFDGQLGHHYKALTALHDFYGRLLDRHPTCWVIVSGDITANGALTQFDMAHSYLGDRTSAPNFGLGLGLPEWPNSSISGNHDQSPGNNLIVGPHTIGLTKYFKRPFPIFDSTVEIQKGLALRFLFIDTDADVGSYGFDRCWARGDFVSQLTALRDQIAPNAPGEIRVLVMHHSMMPAAPQPSSADATAPRRLAITNRTRRVLDHFLVDYGIKIVMCGHMHVPRLTRYNASNGTEKTTVLEARCGTTTQRDEFPYEIIQSIPVSRRLPPNTLIVHQVIERNRSLLWQSKIFWRNRSGRFVDSTQHTSPSVPQHLTAELELRPS